MSRFRLWSPDPDQIELHLLEPIERTIRVKRQGVGRFERELDAAEGSLYRLRVGAREVPDPASRFQPLGVHGPSQIVDPSKFRWNDQAWNGVRLDELILYELHVGTFTPEGSFTSAATRLPYLRELGITAVELMPVAEFPGRRGWGYDGVDLGAPARCYGTPEELRAFVDSAHREELAVLLDFVCNHLGPDGNYLGVLSRRFFSERHRTPWGSALNFDGPDCGAVRRFFIDMARRWIDEYHFDGLRFDAAHAISDDSPRHILAEIASALRAEFRGRNLLFIAEDNRNLARIVRSRADGGWGLDAVWSDDFHHSLRRLLAGDREGYFQNFNGTVEELAGIADRGWRAAPSRGLRPESRVFFIQNHDQVGNRALGERLHHQIDPAAYRAASALLFASPETPLVFMGQEWASSAPFQYFTDLPSELGGQVTRGRREEFREFAAFSNEAARRAIPDPQDEETFRRSRLIWEENRREPHAAVLRLYRALLALRRQEPALRGTGEIEVRTFGGSILLVRRPAGGGRVVSAAVQLKGGGRVELPRGDWETLLSTEEPRFTADPMLPEAELSGPHPFLRFVRPGALFLTLREASGR